MRCGYCDLDPKPKIENCKMIYCPFKESNKSSYMKKLRIKNKNDVSDTINHFKK